MSQMVRLVGDSQRQLACKLIMAAPPMATVKISPENRTTDQNALLWALLSDVSRSKPGGRKMTPEAWKAVMMNACGHAVQFEIGLSGEPFPMGFRSSRLTKKQCGDLIDFISAWGSENGVRWSEPIDLPGR